MERGGVVVVCDSEGAPDWVVDWCRRSGRWLRRHELPAASPDDFTAAAQRVGTIAEIASAAARHDSSVLVVSGAVSPPRSGRPQVVAAVQALPDDGPVLAAAATAALHRHADLVVAHGVPTSFAERSVGLDAALDHADRLLATSVAAAQASAPDLTVVPLLLRVRPYEMVGEGLDADLLVIGGPRTFPPGPLGLVAHSALHHAPCSVLLTPRAPRPEFLPDIYS
ncbi:universal stress protein [Pseudonocardia alaniniphila]|uniref:Universal stress protein n=1 Tax=Pseudonocardia alaniniphila TaxID=75291 RepID=A0ABS9TKK9_9PSEU|nr:universal stress protein [Pseudonocardia alaniniphila]MCH6168943.1 universal stress protein [Pseudonocardia alaniniphila]